MENTKKKKTSIEGPDLWLSCLPPLAFETVPPFAVDHADAVEGAHDQQGPRDADAHRSQHPRHVTSLRRWSKESFSFTQLVSVVKRRNNRGQPYLFSDQLQPAPHWKKKRG